MPVLRWTVVRVTTLPTDGIFPDFDQARFERKYAVTGSFYRRGIQVLRGGKRGIAPVSNDRQ